MRRERNARSVGLTYVRIRISRGPDGPSRTFRLLVDAGATHTMLPRAILEALRVVPTRRMLVRLGDGRQIERGLGEAYVRYRSYATHTWLLFGEPGDASVLGALTLEELSLEVDPKSRRLREVKEALMVDAIAC